jgi:hypothetical protein
LRAVEELAVAKRPIANTNAYEQEPAELRSLRIRLFGIFVSGDDLSAIAQQILITIDERRDEYGRPISEPRHPNLSANTPWPSEALVAWQALPPLAANVKLEAVSTRPDEARPSDIRSGVGLKPSFFGIGIDLKPLLNSAARFIRNVITRGQGN